MNWTPDYNYNGNSSGWNDGNPNGHRIDSAPFAKTVPSVSRPRGLLRVVLIILLLAGIVAAGFTVKLFSSLATPNNHSHRKDLSR